MQESNAFLPSPESSDKAARKLHFGNWGTYAAAAGAALAMSTSASAEIVYGTVDVTASASLGTQSKAFTIAGFDESLFVANLSHSGTAVGTDAAQTPPDLQFFARQSHGDAVAKAYALGQMITGGDASFGPGALLRQHNASNNVGAFGPGTVTGFVGFKIDSAGTKGGDLGWLQVRVSDSGTPGYPNEAEVIDWAYDDTGAAIAAGDTGVAPTPEPGSVALGLLALGAAGILALRKRRNELAVK